jgi:hypothetical protein
VVSDRRLTLARGERASKEATMKKLLAALAVVTAGAVGVMVSASGGSSAPVKPGGNQADSARFVLHLPIVNGERYTGQVLYCGVQTLSEPFRFDLVATAPPNLTIPDDPTSPYESGHDGSAWLDVKFQDSSGAEGQEAYRVATNDSFAFGLTLGGNPGKDQLVRVMSQPLGDVDGRGMDFRGVASVLAQPGAMDPFTGDGRTDDYCVTIGVADGTGPPPGSEPPAAEFEEGDISITLPVPDDWVLDDDGSDGGVLRGMPTQ